PLLSHMTSYMWCGLAGLPSQPEYKPDYWGCLAGRGLVSGRRREQGRDLLRERDALVEHAVQDLRPEAARLELRDDLAVGRGALLVHHEDVLHGDHVLLHAHDLGDGGDLARPVAQPVQLHDEVDRARDLLPDCAHGEVDAGHQDQRLETRESVTRAVGMKRRHRTVVAGVHRLQHVERFAATTLTDHDALGAHTERVDDEALDWGIALAVRSEEHTSELQSR